MRSRPRGPWRQFAPPPGDWQDWQQWRQGGAWWHGQASGWAWRGIARRMFVGLVLMASIGTLSLILLGVLLARWFGSGWVAVIAAPLVVVGLAILAGRWIAGTWRPVRDLMQATGRLADGDYSARVTPSGTASIRPIAASFNDMARRLEQTDEQRRRLLADLGHELRTPLTVIRGEIEAMLDGVHEPDGEHLELLLGEVRVMERLLEDLRTLSLAESGALALHPVATDVVDLAADVAETYRRGAEDAGIAIHVTGDPAAPDVVLDPVRIREVLSNLVVNALRAMPDGGHLTISVEASPAACIFRVADSGVGIPPEQLDHVFDRFSKGDGSDGSGLGLTISRDLVVAHDGTIEISSQLGQGTVATVTLPRRAEPAG